MPILNALEQINNMGFVSTDGQPGLCDGIQFQRAYINGFIENRKKEAFIQELIALSNQKIIIIEEPYAKSKKNITGIRFTPYPSIIHGTITPDLFKSDEKKTRINLTYAPNATSSSGSPYVTNYPLGGHDNSEYEHAKDYSKILFKILTTETKSLFIVYKDYCNMTLLELVKKSLINISK